VTIFLEAGVILGLDNLVAANDIKSIVSRPDFEKLRLNTRGGLVRKLTEAEFGAMRSSSSFGCLSDEKGTIRLIWRLSVIAAHIPPSGYRDTTATSSFPPGHVADVAGPSGQSANDGTRSALN
jgi:hypothetical protein